MDRRWRRACRRHHGHGHADAPEAPEAPEAPDAPDAGVMPAALAESLVSTWVRRAIREISARYARIAESVAQRYPSALGGVG